MKIRKFMFRVWYWLFNYSLHKCMKLLRRYHTATVANRHINTMWIGPLEITVQYRDTRQNDGYGRHEMLEMLENLRIAEQIHQWRVPEPPPARLRLCVERYNETGHIIGLMNEVRAMEARSN